MVSLNDLPAPPPDRKGYPWTIDGPALPTRLPGNQPFPRISIVTPSFRHGRYIEETIRSILLQGYPNLEYFIMDGGSTDETTEILQKYSPFLAGWVSERDSGQANAINKGLRQTTGQILSYLNSDDILLPGTLHTVAKNFTANSKIQLVTGFRKVIDQDSNFVTNWFRDRPTRHYVRHYCCVAQETTFWSRTIWEDLGEFDESFHYAMDYEYWLRAIDRGYSFHQINRYLGGFRDYPQNKTNSLTQTYARDMELLISRYNLGNNESEIQAELGTRWFLRYQTFIDLGYNHWTDHISLVNAARRIMELPLIGDLVLVNYRIHRNSKANSQGNYLKHHIASTLGILRNAIVSPISFPRHRHYLNSNATSIAEIEENNSPSNAESIGKNRLALGNNWYMLESYAGEVFRWANTDAELIILNPDTQEKHLLLDVQSATDQESALALEDASTGYAQMEPITEIRKQVRFKIALYGTDPITLKLKFSGAAPITSKQDTRLLNFRVFRIGWDTPIFHLETKFIAFTEALSLTNPTQLGNIIPLFRKIQRSFRSLRFLYGTQEAEIELLKEIVSTLDNANKRVDALQTNKTAESSSG